MKNNKSVIVLITIISILLFFNIFFLIEIYNREKKILVKNINEGLNATIDSYKKYALKETFHTRNNTDPFYNIQTEKKGALNIIRNSDFEEEYNSFSSAYDKLPALIANINPNDNGWYWITSNPNTQYGNWHGKGYGGQGKFLLLDGSSDYSKFGWSQQASVKKSTRYLFKINIATMAITKGHKSLNYDWQLANLLVIINDSVIGTAKAPNEINKWEEHSFSWNSEDDTIAKIKISDLNTGSSYNDFAIDHISLKEAADQTTLSLNVIDTIKNNKASGIDIDTNVVLGLFENEMRYKEISIDYKLAFFNSLDMLNKLKPEIFQYNKENKYYESYYIINDKLLSSSFFYLDSGNSVICYTYNYKIYLLLRIKMYIISSLFFIFISFFLIYLVYRSFAKEKQISNLKYQLTNNITHELKTPVAIILAAVEGLQKFKLLEDKEKTKDYIEMTRIQALKLNMLIDNVMKLAVLEESDFKLSLTEVNINEVIIEILEGGFKNACKVEVELCPDSRVTVDKFHFTNIISSLIDNAVKYTIDKSILTIKTIKEGNHFYISIKDNGIGIPEEYNKLIFDKYFRVPTNDTHNVKGHGLGLSYVKNIMDLHRASVSVKSDGKNGSEFILKFNL